ncbi:hypothetical protein LTR84_005153 [Exophiala bonariae]|uniref:Vint domain-containing protein n=1 Tax=Exophiala bonariae TaxID=1690606 RepID=A0AAV9NRI9_9EURO|nr:hypothetical protein LTR84_005153 [Exophiala bonariae]
MPESRIPVASRKRTGNKFWRRISIKFTQRGEKPEESRLVKVTTTSAPKDQQPIKNTTKSVPKNMQIAAKDQLAVSGDHDSSGKSSDHRTPNQLAASYYYNMVASQGVDGCFGGESLVHMDGGATKPVKELKKGDLVQCNDEGEIAEVKCVLVQQVAGGTKAMVKFENGLVITPMHPIMSEGVWALPKDMQDSHQVDAKRVFNFLLDKQHTIVVNGVVCSALGHHRKGHTWHPFWGNWHQVMSCMRRVDEVGFENGSVEIAGTVRDQKSGTVYGFRCIDGTVVAQESK